MESRLVLVATSSLMVHRCITFKYDASPQHRVTNCLGRRFTGFSSSHFSLPRHSFQPTLFYNSQRISKFSAGSHHHHRITYISDPFVMNKSSRKTRSSISTAKCTAEERAWLLVYTNRISQKKILSHAFNKQFASKRRGTTVQRLANNVKSCDAAVKSQLLDLAKTMPWYVSLESKVPLRSLVISLEQVWGAFVL